MPANAFAVATTVGVVLGGPALFCVLIGKNPLPSTSIDTQVAAELVLPVYAPPKPALAVVQEPAAEAQPIHVADGASAAAAPPNNSHRSIDLFTRAYPARTRHQLGMLEQLLGGTTYSPADHSIEGASDHATHDRDGF